MTLAERLAGTMASTDRDAALCPGCGGDGVDASVSPWLRQITRLTVILDDGRWFPAVSTTNPLRTAVYRADGRGYFDVLPFSLSEACGFCYGTGRRSRPVT